MCWGSTRKPHAHWLTRHRWSAQHRKQGVFLCRRKRLGVRACLALEEALRPSTAYTRIDLHGNAVRRRPPSLPGTLVVNVPY